MPRKDNNSALLSILSLLAFNCSIVLISIWVRKREALTYNIYTYNIYLLTNTDADTIPYKYG